MNFRAPILLGMAVVIWSSVCQLVSLSLLGLFVAIKKGLEEVSEMEVNGKSPSQAGMSLSPLLPLINPYSKQSLGQGCHQRLSVHQQFCFPPSWQLWRQFCLRLQLANTGSYLSESAAARRGIWGGCRGLPCTLCPGEEWLLGWDRDTAPAAVPLWFICVLGITAAESKREK